MSIGTVHANTEKRLLDNQTYENLRAAQQKIQEKTDLTPNFRKMINLILTEENINLMTDTLIQQYT